MNELLKNIENGIDIDKNVNKVLYDLSKKSISIDDLIFLIKQDCADKCEVLNLFGVKSYENGFNDYIIPFFNAALMINPNYRDALINMGNILNLMKEYKLAIKYLTRVKPMDKETLSLIEDIGKKIKQNLKFALRRIENDIDVENSREEVYNMISEKEISKEDIFESVKKDLIKKDKVLNSIGVKFYEKGLYDEVIPMFEKSYEYNNKNPDTLYNLGYFLYKLNEKRLALIYLRKLNGTNYEANMLIKRIEGEA